MRSLLLAFGFSEVWVNWIMKLTFSTFFSIQVNGVPSNPFSPSCGIRQGYPIFPFLFVILAKVLRQYTKSPITDGSLKVLSLHGINPHILHNQFIDDTMMMGVPTVWEAHHILSILNDFNEAYDTTIHIDKSHIFFFNTPRAIQSHITHILGFIRSSLLSKYIGIPLINNSLKNCSWEDILEAIDKWLSSWTFHSLNLAGLLVLSNSVLQAIPIYVFSALAAPKSVLKIINNIQR
jgi:hypothetical protein